MKIRKIGRERPVLYRGKFDVPVNIVSRLAVSQNHLILAEMANFNAKVDQLYLAIDNALSAVLMAKEGTQTTTDHRKKIAKFFKHLGRRAKVRSIAQSDFEKFYSLWLKSRYRLYFPNSLSIHEMEMFAWHLHDFVITEISRFFKSDETITADKVQKLQRIYECKAILEAAAFTHEMSQMRLEEEGEISGGKLELKLLNPWNYIRVSLLSDHEKIVEMIDLSKETRRLLRNFVESWDKLIKKIVWMNIERIGLEIANAKLRKKRIRKQQAIEEAIEETRGHPEILRFRLALNLSYDSMSAKEEIAKWAKIIAASVRNDQCPNKALKNAWENYKSRNMHTKLQHK